ncbi:MAG: DUF1840 family protein [Betaproteobacteria bacterium]|nr:DUF1840 family protein [Betaproteobacteria bacterium]
MYIRFDSEVGTFIMKGDIATELIRMMGHSGTVPSALLAKDVPAALTRLRAAVDDLPPPSGDADEDDEDDEREPVVSLRQRAYPLIDLLGRAAKSESDVTWKVEPPGSMLI